MQVLYYLNLRNGADGQAEGAAEQGHPGVPGKTLIQGERVEVRGVDRSERGRCGPRGQSPRKKVEVHIHPPEENSRSGGRERGTQEGYRHPAQ